MEHLAKLIQGKIGRHILSLSSIDSTNSFAMELCAGDAPHGTVVLADMQTAGKGRLGRKWISPPGRNILMSVLLRPGLPPHDSTLLTIMASVACSRALRETTGLLVGIKWPNDLMFGEMKLGGILTEVRSNAGQILCAVVGIGLNVNSEPEDFPAEVRTIATSLKIITGSTHSRATLIAGILNEMDRWHDLLLTGKKEALLTEWKRLASTLGKPVKVKVNHETVAGIAEDIDRSGMLLLRLPSGEVRKISAGDLTMLREETG